MRHSNSYIPSSKQGLPKPTGADLPISGAPNGAPEIGAAAEGAQGLRACGQTSVWGGVGRAVAAAVGSVRRRRKLLTLPTAAATARPTPGPREPFPTGPTRAGGP